MTAPYQSDCFQSPGTDGRLMSLDWALAALLTRIQPLTETETVPLQAANRRILAADQVSTVTVPPFANAAMDGWAMAHRDLVGTTAITLPIGGRIAAGHPLTEPVKPGHAYRIFTGAPLPEGLDSVVMQEQARTDEAGFVTIPPGVTQGSHVRLAGESIALGSTPLTAGTRLYPQHLGVAATMGLTHLPVIRRVRVAIFSTGDEIRQPGEPLPAGAIYDANRTTLAALLSELGCVVTDLGILPDQPAPLTAALRDAAPHQDLILTSGGVSVGEEDHIKAAVSELGALHAWKLAIKPGKPLAVGQICGVPFLGLPGNPVAVMVTFLLFGRPLVLRMSGGKMTPPPRYELPAAFSLTTKPGRREFPRARLQPSPFGLTVALLPSESSGVMTSLSAADGLLDLPETGVTIHIGDPVAFLSFAEMLG